ncbi:MAG: sigma factor-like helix-turn-helix DNA-binding protein [Bacillota bacterium]
MGSATNKTDQHATHEAKYHALDSAANVRLLLGDYHALKQRRFAGDYAACDVLIDLERAIELAGLTARQRQALGLVYEADLTQVEAGRRMGISQQAVEQFVKAAEEAIADIYYYWASHGEGYRGGDTE